MPLKDSPGKAWAATLLLLAGGTSRRMGTPKALLPVGAETLLEWQCRRLGPFFAEVLVAANEPALVPASVRRVGDLRPGSLGPLAGIEAGLSAAAHDALLVVACDMPWVEAAMLGELFGSSAGFDAAVPRIAGRPEPVCACFRRSALPVITAALDAGARRAAAALESLRVSWLDGLNPQLFWNINTPSDYQLFRSSLSRPTP